MKDDAINVKTQVKSQQKESWVMKLKEILDQSKQLIDVKNY